VADISSSFTTPKHFTADGQRTHTPAGIRAWASLDKKVLTPGSRDPVKPGERSKEDVEGHIPSPLLDELLGRRASSALLNPQHPLQTVEGGV